MGTDIHMYAETKNNRGKWRCILDEKGNPRRFDLDRNYDLFAILADVRNGYGFAGCNTGNGFVVKYEPRGLPNDISERLALDGHSDDEDDYEKYAWLGDHSFSHLTLTEVLSLDFDKVSTRHGWVSWNNFVKWETRRFGAKINTPPPSYSGGVFGGSVTHTTAEDFMRRFNSLSWDDRRAIAYPKVDSDDAIGGEYAQVSWVITYGYAMRDFFLNAVMPMLSLAISESLGYDDIRFVFGFDS